MRVRVYYRLVGTLRTEIGRAGNEDGAPDGVSSRRNSGGLFKSD